MPQHPVPGVLTYLADGDPRTKVKYDRRKFHCEHNPKHSECKDKRKSFMTCDSQGHPLWAVTWAPCMKTEAVDHMMEAHQFDYNGRRRPVKGSDKSHGRNHGQKNPKHHGTSSGRGPSPQMAAEAPAPYQQNLHTQAGPPQHSQYHQPQPQAQPQPPLEPAYAPSPSQASFQPRSYPEEEARMAQARAPSRHSRPPGSVARFRAMREAPPPMSQWPPAGQQSGWAQQQFQQHYQQPPRQHQEDMHHSRPRTAATTVYDSELEDNEYPDGPEMPGYGGPMPAHGAASFTGMGQQPMMGPPPAFGMGAGPGEEMPSIENLNLHPRPSRAPSRAPPSYISRLTQVPRDQQMTSAMGMAMAAGAMPQPAPRYMPGSPGAQPPFTHPQGEPTPPPSDGDDRASMVFGNPMYSHPMDYVGHPQGVSVSQYGG